MALRARPTAAVPCWPRAALLLGLAAGCGTDPSAGEPPEVRSTNAQRASILRPDDLLVVDADAGGPGPDGEPAGLLFVARVQGDGTYGEPEVLVADPGWREPVDVLPLSGDRMLVLDSQGVPGGPPSAARGVLSLVDLAAGTVTPWWTDPRLRQPVGLARGPDGRVYVSDRAADPADLGGDTGAVFVLPARFDPEDRTAPSPLGADVPVLTSAALVTPAALLATRAGAILLMDADANPRGVPGTPGVLFEIVDDALVVRLEPAQTTSPLGLIETADGLLYLVDCNEGREPDVFADGALFRIEPDGLVKVIDSRIAGRPKALHDPAYGDTLRDGRLAVADANLDVLGVGPVGTKGFAGTGPGCVVALDPAAGTVTPLVVSRRFVTPVCVRRIRP